MDPMVKSTKYILSSLIFFILSIFLIGCNNYGEENATIEPLTESNWSKASWIGYEAWPDSLKIIPGVHGSGNHLGDKGLRRPVVPHFRREFQVEKRVEEAWLHVSGLGHYTLSLDGQPLDDRFLAPGWSLYSKTCLYNSYEVSRQLKRGSHVLGLTVGNGFFNVNRERYRKLVSAWGAPMMRLMLRIQYADGSHEELVSDSTWQTASSPITFSSIYGGEDFDARLIHEGWQLSGFDDSGWQSALVVEGPGGVMKPETDHPLKIMQSFEALKISPMSDGSYVYDFGQNASGIPEIRVRGAAGQAVRMIPGELIGDDGAVTQQASGGPSWFEYICTGGDPEVWRPVFTYYGFRYVQVTGAVPEGYPNPDRLPVVEELLFHHTRNSAPTVGSFNCSNELFNRIHDLIDWSVRSNLASVATDCPHREKLGWLEVPHLMGTSIQYVYDVSRFYSKIVDDMIDSQLENGLVPDIAPEYVPFAGGFRDSPEWGSSAVIIPWQLHEWYGDSSAMHRAWPMMVRYMEYLGSKADRHILSHGLGDWFDLGQQSPGSSQLTPLALTATAIWYYDLTLMVRMAHLMNRPAEMLQYASLADSVKGAFIGRFYDDETGVIATGSQTSYAMPLVVGLVDDDNRSLVFANLLAAIERDGYALTAGDVGFHYLVRVLADAGAHEVIWKMNARDDVPGYGYQLKMGATALTESWPALRYVSNNHMMLGHLMEWLYSGIGGIRQAEGSTGYERIIIDPQPVGDLTWAEVSHTCILGTIWVRWDKEVEKVEKVENDKKVKRGVMEFWIPEGCEAEVSFGGKYLGRYLQGRHRVEI